MKISYRYITLLILIINTSFTGIAADRIPIIAFSGVPSEYSDSAHFAEFREAGFDVSLAVYMTQKELFKALQEAQKAKVKLLPVSPTFKDHPAVIIPKMKQYKSLFGYYIADEPNMDELEMYGQYVKNIKKYDSSHPCYINLFPCYDEGTLKMIRTTSYSNYLRKASSYGLQQISFDFYPIRKSGILPTWYENLELIRKESLRTKKPFWGFVLCTPHNDYPQPTIATLRLQMYSNLLYGAQAIQYFTYWQPTGTNIKYFNAPIDANGKKTMTYSLVQLMNKELALVSPLFKDCKVKSIYHIGPKTPKGTISHHGKIGKIQGISCTSTTGVLVSKFTKNGITYVGIQNKDYTRNTIVNLKLGDSSLKRVTKQLTYEGLKSSYNLPPGDIIIIKM